jgi:hypothetical protein
MLVFIAMHNTLSLGKTHVVATNRYCDWIEDLAINECGIFLMRRVTDNVAVGICIQQSRLYYTQSSY